jgi:hypothetical protein
MLNNNLQGTLQLNNLDTIHNHQTRLKSQHNFYMNSIKSGLGKQGFNAIAPKFWREVPTELKLLNFGAFKFKF